MSGMHTPTPEFRDALERRITSELQRQARTSRATWLLHSPRLRTAALVTLALGLGAIAGAVPAQVQDAREREQLMAAVQAEQRLAEMRLQLARAAYDQARQKYEAGVLGRASLASAEEQYRAMELALARLQLNQEEIRATAAPPRDDIFSPLVGRRDFVSARLELQLSEAQRRLATVESAMAEAQQKLRVGATTRQAMIDAETQLARARADMQRLAGLRELRQTFLRENLDAAEAERRLQRVELVMAAELTRKLHELARERHEHMQQLEGIGQVDQLEVMRAELAVLELALEVQRIMRELELLRGTGRDESSRQP